MTQNGKSFCLTANYHEPYPEHTLKRSVRTVAEPVFVAQRVGIRTPEPMTKGEGGSTVQGRNRWENKCSQRLKDNAVAKPVRVGCYPSPDGTLKNSQGMRLYSIEGKSVNLTANGGAGQKQDCMLFQLIIL